MRYALLFLLSVPLQAATVKDIGITDRLIIVTQDEENTFKPFEYLCVVEENIEIACGFVTTAFAQKALVDLEIRSQKLVVGMQVARSKKHRPCNPKNIFTPNTPPRQEPDLTNVFHRDCNQEETKIASGYHLPSKYYFALGFNFLSPKMEGAIAVAPHFSLGLSIDLVTFTSSLPSIHASSTGTAYGGHVILTFHLSDPFRGLYVSYGLGQLKGRLSLRNHLSDWTGLSMVGAVGYRLMRWDGFGVGVSLGGYYLKFSNAETVTPTYFLSPFLGVEFGITF